MKVVVEADGGSRGNPGPAGYGAVVYDAARGEVLAERAEFLGVATNNVAEYRGLIAGLTAARELGAREVAVRMDSKLVVEQMKGAWQVKHPALRPLAREAVALRASFDTVSFEWIPRELNRHADRLANEAMDRGSGRPSSGPAVPPPSWTPPAGTPTRLLLVRHGATEHSAERRFSGRNELPLDAQGSQQAAALAKKVATFGPVAAVVSSPLRRARQTADVIGGALGVPVEVQDGFAELDFGAWEGLTADEVQTRYPVEYAAFAAADTAAPPGGESFSALARRTRRGRDAVIAAYGGQTVAVVTHVSPIKVLLRIALEAPYISLFRLHLDTASVSEIAYFADGNCSVRLVNDTGHLTGL